MIRRFCRTIPLGLLPATLLLTIAAGCTTGGRRAPSAAEPVEVVEEFWPDGTPKTREEVIRQPDGSLVKNGCYTSWHNNGNKAYEATYDHGELNGVAHAWHKNGQLWTEEHYDHGVREGLRRNWDEKGRLRGEESYAEGKPDGTWTIWKGDGTVEWQESYDHGQPK